MEQAPDPTITLEDYHSEMSSVYDVLSTVWLHAKDPKVIESVLHALSEIVTVLSAEKIRQHAVKMVMPLMMMVRKQRVTQASTK